MLLPYPFYSHLWVQFPMMYSISHRLIKKNEKNYFDILLNDYMKFQIQEVLE